MKSKDIGKKPITLRGSEREATRLENLGKAVEAWYKQYRHGNKNLCDEAWSAVFDACGDLNLQASFSHSITRRALGWLVKRRGRFCKNGWLFRKALKLTNKEGRHSAMAICMLKEYQIQAEIEQASIEYKNRWRRSWRLTPMHLKSPDPFPLREATRRDGPDRNKTTISKQDGQNR